MSSSPAIPIIDLVGEYESLKKDIDAAIKRVLASGHFVLGPEGDAFEKELASYSGVPFAVALNSGTDALVLALKALGVREGDDVVVPAFSFFATAEAVALVGANPVFTDIDLTTYAIDVRDATRKITSKTKVLIAVHLYGQPADLDLLHSLCAQRKIGLIEDMAQALGARFDSKPVGGVGQVSCLSFYPTKNLGAAGDAGAILTRDKHIAASIRRLRNHGADRKYFHDDVGYNSRLDEIQAALLRVKLPLLDAWTRARQERAERYTKELHGLPLVLPEILPKRSHAFHLYTVRTPDRDKLQAALLKEGIHSAIHYPVPMHLQKAFSSFGGKVGEFPNAEQAAREVLSLPLYPQLGTEAQTRVIQAIRTFFKHA